MIGVLVVARKLMLQDFATLDVQALLGFGGLLLALEESIGFSRRGPRACAVRVARAASGRLGQDHQQRQTERTTGRPNCQTRTGTQPQRPLAFQ